MIKYLEELEDVVKDESLDVRARAEALTILYKIELEKIKESN